MAEPTQLLQQAKAGQFSMEGLRQFAAQGTPNITQPQAPPDVGGGDFMSGLRAFARQQPAQSQAPMGGGLPRAKTQLYNQQELAALKDEPSVMGDIIAPTAQAFGTSVYRGLVKGTTGLIDLGSYVADYANPLQTLGQRFTQQPAKPNAAQQVRQMTQIANNALPEQSKNIGARIAEETAAAVPASLLLAGPVSVASKAAQAGNKVPWLLKGMADDLTRLGPKAYAEFEAFMNMVGAAGGELAVEANEALGQTVPEWMVRLGGSIGAVLGVNGATNLFNAGRARLSSRSTTRPEKARKQVGRVLAAQAPVDLPIFQSAAREAENLSGAIPDFRLATAVAEPRPGYQKLTTANIAQRPELAEAAVEHVARNREAHYRFFQNSSTRMNLNDDVTMVDRVRDGLKSMEQAVVDQVNAEVASAQQAAQLQLAAQRQAGIAQQQGVQQLYGAQVGGMQQQLTQAQAPVSALQGQVTGELAAPAIAIEAQVTNATQNFRRISDAMFQKAGQQVGNEAVFSLNTIKRSLGGIAKEMKGGLTKAGDLVEQSPTLRRLTGDIAQRGKGKQLVPYKYMREVYSETGEEIAFLKRRASLGQAGQDDKKLMGMLIKVQKASQKELDRLDGGDLASKYPQAAQALGDAKRVFKEGAYELRSQHMKRFTALNQSGQRTIDDSIKAGDKLLQSADETGRYLRVFSGFGETGTELASYNSPEAKQELIRFAQESFMEKATRNGKVDYKAMRQWRNQHKGVAAIPELDRQLKNVESAQKMVDDLSKGINEAQAASQKQLGQMETGLARELETGEKALEGQITNIRSNRPKTLVTDDYKALENYTWDADPHVVIEEVMSSQKPLQGLQAIVRQVQGDEAAVRGLGKTLWDHMDRHFFEGVDFKHPAAITDHKKIGQFLDNYMPVLKQIYSSEQISNLKTFQRAAMRMDEEAKLLIRPSGNPKLERETEQIAGTMHLILKKVGGALFGTGGDLPYTVANAKASKVINSWSAQQDAAMTLAMREALFDPQAARLMREAAKDPSSQIFKNRLLNYMNTHSNAINTTMNIQQNAKERRRQEARPK